MTDQNMHSLAKTYRSRAYAPYSNFLVGAVVKGANGKLYGGCNVENAAYPVGCCAEASAISAMVSDGETKIAEILVMAAGKEMISPCGSCRQRIREFADPGTPVHLATSERVEMTVPFGELLPYAFGHGHLGD